MTPAPEIAYVGSHGEVETVLAALAESKGTDGVFVLVEAPSGFGLSTYLRELRRRLQQRPSPVSVAYAECPAPLGGINVGELKPLYPFKQLIEQAGSKKSAEAKKELAKNISMTLLSAVPFLGDFVFAAKEIKRDLKEYKNASKDIEGRAVDSARLVDDIWIALKALASDSPLLLIVDDFQWSDPLSVRLIATASEALKGSNLSIVLGVNTDELPAHKSVDMLLRDLKHNKAFHTSVALGPIRKAAIESAFLSIQPRHKAKAAEVAAWVDAKAAGNPSVAVEYLKYIAAILPSEGAAGDMALEDLASKADIPPTLSALFRSDIDKLDDAARDFLAVCSVEGRSFTVWMAAKLHNTDPLAVIRTLRGIGRRSSILRKVGVEKRYEADTTVYEFSHPVVFELLHSELEFEERRALHLEIAAILRRHMSALADDGTSDTLVPFLSAHSLAAGIDVSDLYRAHAESMRGALGIDALPESLRLALTEYPPPSGSAESPRTAASAPGFVDVRTRFVRLLSENRAREARDYLLDMWTAANNTWGKRHRAQASVLLFTAYLKLGEYDGAEKWLHASRNALHQIHDVEWECLFLNMMALYHAGKQEYRMAEQNLYRASELALKGPAALRLVTTANIAELTEEKAETRLELLQAARRLSDEMGMEQISADIEQRIAAATRQL